MAKSSPKKHPTKATAEPLNPFSVTASGLSRLFSGAQSVAIFLLALGIIGMIYSVISSVAQTMSTPQSAANAPLDWNAFVASISTEQIIGWSIAFVIITVFLMTIYTMLDGITAYTALQLSKGRTATLREGFNATLDSFLSFFWLTFLKSLKIFLWTLLFIIPGIIAAYRYAFASMMFFDPDKQLRGNAALRESSRLGKKGLLTIYSSIAWFDLLTFGNFSPMVQTAVLPVLYRDYLDYEKDGVAKPPAHLLSWLILIIPIALILLLIILMAVIYAFVFALSAR